MIDATTSTMMLSLIPNSANNSTDPRSAVAKPERDSVSPMTPATAVPSLAAMGIYSAPTATSGAPGQGEPPSGQANGRGAQDDGLSQLRALAMNKASAGYAQAGGAIMPPVPGQVDLAV